jgi:hypothetical protein
MSCNSAVVLTLLLGSLIASPQTLAQESPAQGIVLAQLIPPAGAAGAGNAPINGIPYGPGNPSVISDPTGALNASKLPPLGHNTPAPLLPGPSIGSPRPTTTPVVGASQQRLIATETVPGKKPLRGRGRPQVSHFTGICRGC